MIYRTIFDELTAHLPKPQATVITGMRRVGKSTALRFLLNQVPHHNKIYLDLERAEYRFILNQTNYKDIEINLAAIEEIDFIANGNVAVEVKETPTASDVHQLRTRAAGIGMEDCRLVGRTLPASGFTNFYRGGAIV